MKPDTKTVYKINSLKKTLEYMDQLSIANYTLDDQNKKIILGKPDNILFIEDLCVRFSLEELGLN